MHAGDGFAVLGWCDDVDDGLAVVGGNLTDLATDLLLGRIDGIDTVEWGY